MICLSSGPASADGVDRRLGAAKVRFATRSSRPCAFEAAARDMRRACQFDRGRTPTAG
jgi:hypothetical protein